MKYHCIPAAFLCFVCICSWLLGYQTSLLCLETVCLVPALSWRKAALPEGQTCIPLLSFGLAKTFMQLPKGTGTGN